MVMSSRILAAFLPSLPLAMTSQMTNRQFVQGAPPRVQCTRGDWVPGDGRPPCTNCHENNKKTWEVREKHKKTLENNRNIGNHLKTWEKIIGGTDGK